MPALILFPALAAFSLEHITLLSAFMHYLLFWLQWFVTFSGKLSCLGSSMRLAKEDLSMAEQVSIVNSALVFLWFVFAFGWIMAKSSLKFTWLIILFFNHPTLLFFLSLYFCVLSFFNVCLTWLTILSISLFNYSTVFCVHFCFASATPSF